MITSFNDFDQDLDKKTVNVVALIGRDLHCIGANVFNWSQTNNTSKFQFDPGMHGHF